MKNKDRKDKDNINREYHIITSIDGKQYSTSPERFNKLKEKEIY